MTYVTKDNIFSKFQTHLSESKTTRIAVAWATPGHALEAFLKFAKKAKEKPKIIVGISGNSTDPYALQCLSAVTDLKVTKGTGGTFHPKYYAFCKKDKPIIWIGSANFSARGFGLNDELMHEFQGEYGETGDWFDDLWNDLPDDTSEEMEEYISNWTPPPKGREKALTIVPSTDHPIELFLNKKIKSWKDFLNALNQCDSYWDHQGYHFSVLDEHCSYLHTITKGKQIAHHDDWATFEKSDVEVLMGYHDPIGLTGYGLLGSMKGAPIPTNIFLQGTKENLKIRVQIEDIVKSLKNSSARNFAYDAGQAVEQISSFKRFAGGVATRLITLAFPDKAISVNDGSCYGLALISGVGGKGSTLNSAKNYEKLLNWLYQEPWYNVAAPSKDSEKVLWEIRAAILDAFVYGYKP